MLRHGCAMVILPSSFILSFLDFLYSSHIEGMLLILYLLAVVISAWLLKIVSEKIYNIFVG